VDAEELTPVWFVAPLMAEAIASAEPEDELPTSTPFIIN
jgi:hypothetical protein